MPGRLSDQSATASAFVGASAPEGYEKFQKKKDGAVKVLLQP